MREDRGEHSQFKAMMDAVRRMLGDRPPQLPADPYAERMARVRRGPKGRSGAASVAEPEEESYRAFPPRER